VVGVRAHIALSGQIELTLPAESKRVHGDAGCTAMWVSLQMCDGNVDEAAEMLAEIWEADSLSVWGAMVLWFAELEEAGILYADEA
jgi:hypothetical protein